MLLDSNDGEKMSEPSLKGFLIALVIVSALAALFGIVLNAFNDQYHSIDQSSVNLSKYDKLNTLYTDVSKIKNQTTTLKQTPGVLDLVGAFFYQSYQVLITIPQSFNLVVDMTDQGFRDANLGQGALVLKNTFVTIVIIMIFIGIILSILLRRGIMYNV